MAFFRTHIKEGAPERRKISSHIVSTAEGGAGVQPAVQETEKKDEKEEDDTIVIIEDPVTFKSGLPLHPRVSPFIDIQTLRKEKKSSGQ